MYLQRSVISIPINFSTHMAKPKLLMNGVDIVEAVGVGNNLVITERIRRAFRNNRCK